MKIIDETNNNKNIQVKPPVEDRPKFDSKEGDAAYFTEQDMESLALVSESLTGVIKSKLRAGKVPDDNRDVRVLMEAGEKLTNQVIKVAEIRNKANADKDATNARDQVIELLKLKATKQEDIIDVAIIPELGKEFTIDDAEIVPEELSDLSKTKLELTSLKGGTE